MPSPVIIEPGFAIGELVYHRTSEIRGMVIAYRVTGDAEISYEVRWGGDDFSDYLHDAFELSSTPTFE